MGKYLPLRINGKIVINLFDLQSSLSGNPSCIWEIYEQKEAFICFAKINSVRLAMKYNDDTLQSTRYLTKDFWCHILAFNEDSESHEQFENGIDFIYQYFDNIDINDKGELSILERINIIESDCSSIRKEYEIISNNTNTVLNNEAKNVLHDILNVIETILINCRELENRRDLNEILELSKIIRINAQDISSICEKLNNISEASILLQNHIKKLNEIKNFDIVTNILKCCEDASIRCSAIAIDERINKANSISLELKQMKIAEKLEHIISVTRTSEKINYLLSFHLLAICELAEINALQLDFRKEAHNSINYEEILAFTGNKDDGKTLYLEARQQPYRFGYYESEILSEGSQISVIKIQVSNLKGKNDTATLQFFTSDNKLKTEFILKKGEYRHCTAANGKFIRLFRTMSINDEICVYRESYSSNQIKLDKKNGESTYISTNGETVIDISVGKDEKEGYLLLKDDGKLLKSHYKNDFIKNMYIKLPIVEMMLIGEGYLFLSSDGLVHSNIKEYKNMRCVRLPRQNSVSSCKNMREGIKSFSENSLVYRDENDDIHFEFKK